MRDDVAQQPVDLDVTELEFQVLLDKHFDRFDWDGEMPETFKGLAQKFGLNTYRTATVQFHKGILWGRRGGAFSWTYKFCPEFNDEIKDAGEYQFNKDSRFFGWRSRPAGKESASDLLDIASSHFSHILDLDRGLILVSRCEDMEPAAEVEAFSPRSKPFMLHKSMVLDAVRSVRQNDEFVDDSLKICNGGQFVHFPEADVVALRFLSAVFTIQAEGRQLRTFTIGVTKDKGSIDRGIAVTSIAYGHDGKAALRQIAEYREGCAGREPWALSGEGFTDDNGAVVQPEIDVPEGRFRARIVSKGFFLKSKAWLFKLELSNGSKTEIFVGISNWNDAWFPLDENHEHNQYNPRFSDINMAQADFGEFYDLTVKKTAGGNGILLDAILVADMSNDEILAWGQAKHLEVEDVDFPICAAIVKSSGKPCAKLAVPGGDLCGVHAKSEKNGKEVVRVPKS